MSHYTTEVRYICESVLGMTKSAGYSAVDNIVAKSAPLIFDFDFPIFDENYRLPLEIKILKHFYTREICCETVGLWKLYLNRKMNEIMPYFNQLYKSSLLEFNPMYEVDITTTHHGSGSTEDDTVSNTEAERKDSNTGKFNTNTNFVSNREDDGLHYDLYSDTPQGALTGVNSEEYLTNATKNTIHDMSSNSGNNTVANTHEDDTESTNTTDSTTNRKIANLDEYVNTVKGKSSGASYSKLLKEFRETFLNIDMLIIDELNTLFFGLW